MSQISAQDLFVESYLEVAQTQRSLVEVQANNADTWQKIFVQRLETRDSNLLIHTTKGEIIPLNQLSFLRFSIDEAEVTAISCACK
ncbi:MAG: hypothetical protein AAF399_05185 [Bacteroidota bacterium]